MKPLGSLSIALIVPFVQDISLIVKSSTYPLSNNNISAMFSVCNIPPSVSCLLINVGTIIPVAKLEVNVNVFDTTFEFPATSTTESDGITIVTSPLAFG